MLKFCSFCQQNIEVQKFQQFGGHRATCTKNPGSPAARLKQSQTLTKPRIVLEKQCPKCQSVFSIISISGIEHRPKKFCSSWCSHSRKQSLTTREKIRAANQKSVKRRCQSCSQEFLPRYKYQRFCSRSCINYVSNWSDKSRQKMSLVAKNRWNAAVRTIGWRNRFEPSYPESFFIARLEECKIDYRKEVQSGRYWIDFVVKSFAIEIDGSTHLSEEAKKHDRLKDQFLSSQGYNVIRIDWTSSNKYDIIKQTLARIA